MKTNDLLTLAVLVGLGFVIFKPPEKKKKTADLADIAKLVAAVAALKKALGNSLTTITALRSRVDELHKDSGAPFQMPAPGTGPVDEFGNPYGSGAVDGW